MNLHSTSLPWPCGRGSWSRRDLPIVIGRLPTDSSCPWPCGRLTEAPSPGCAESEVARGGIAWCAESGFAHLRATLISNIDTSYHVSQPRVFVISVRSRGPNCIHWVVCHTSLRMYRVYTLTSPAESLRESPFVHVQIPCRSHSSVAILRAALAAFAVTDFQIDRRCACTSPSHHVSLLQHPTRNVELVECWFSSIGIA